MGADLIIASCAWPVYRDGTEVRDVTSDHFLTQIIDRIGDKNTDTLDAFCDEYYWGDEFEDTILDFIPVLYRDIRDFLHGMNDGLRDVSIHTFGGRDYILTGGLSWGDDPTDSFRMVCIIDELGIFNYPFEKE